MPELTRHVVLVGPMGAGKTTIGRQLARQLGVPFTDSDHDIEASTGVTISTIFEIEGEDGFRQRETQTLEKILLASPQIVATGGGAILREENRHLMQQHAAVVYLQTTVEQQLKRTRHDKKRPLLQTDNPRDTLENLMKVRAPLYEATADILVSTRSSNVRQLSKTIIQQLKQLGALTG